MLDDGILADDEFLDLRLEEVEAGAESLGFAFNGVDRLGGGGWFGGGRGPTLAGGWRRRGKPGTGS
jgi:hypothetical protein